MTWQTTILYKLLCLPFFKSWVVSCVSYRHLFQTSCYDCYVNKILNIFLCVLIIIKMPYLIKRKQQIDDLFFKFHKYFLPLISLKTFPAHTNQQWVVESLGEYLTLSDLKIQRQNGGFQRKTIKDHWFLKRVLCSFRFLLNIFCK